MYLTSNWAPCQESRPFQQRDRNSWIWCSLSSPKPCRAISSSLKVTSSRWERTVMPSLSYSRLASKKRWEEIKTCNSSNKVLSWNPPKKSRQPLKFHLKSTKWVDLEHLTTLILSDSPIRKVLSDLSMSTMSRSLALLNNSLNSSWLSAWQLAEIESLLRKLMRTETRRNGTSRDSTKIWLFSTCPLIVFACKPSQTPSFVKATTR